MENKFEQMIIKLIEEVKEEKETSVIIGDNSSGKSKFLKEYLEKTSTNSEYYIDSINRNFDYELINNSSMNKGYINLNLDEILKIRINEKNYNTVDTFGHDRIENYYYEFKNDLESLMSSFLEVKFVLDRNELNVNGEVLEQLSNGYKAIIRIFLELLYVEKYLEDVDTILIDELNSFLSVKNEKNFFPFIKNRFDSYKYIITTHSADTISSVKEGELFILVKGEVEKYSLEDFETLTDIRYLFEHLYGEEKTDENIIDDYLRKFLNKKIDNEWNRELEKELSEIENNKKLSNSQKLLIKEIREW